MEECLVAQNESSDESDYERDEKSTKIEKKSKKQQNAAKKQLPPTPPKNDEGNIIEQKLVGVTYGKDPKSGMKWQRYCTNVLKLLSRKLGRICTFIIKIR